MAYAEIPDIQTWKAREKWLQEVEESYQHPLASYLLSPQGVYLSRDMDLAFCAGAWVAVIIIAHAVADAWLRDAELGDYKSNSFQLFGEDEDLQWLRKRRNQMVHVREDQSLIDDGELHKIEENFESLEPEAERAVRIAFKVMYDNPGT
ncbi:hypothetical protein [Desulfatibacillum aliphaticivorans]|uniref:hypothetical protein n=1 Tax=Desulfatibacillum aliphaticivorans TaxID=218208 RepID=UPI000480A318|nr:hypothetical protein [Desulfatibacillum aliphaticivorans]